MKLRGTTSGSSSLHSEDLTASNNASRCFGRTRLPLLLLQRSHSRRYFSAFPHCLAPTGSSLAGNWTLTCSLQRVYWLILTNRPGFVKQLSQNKSFLNASVSPNQKEKAWETVPNICPLTMQHFLRTLQGGFGNVCTANNPGQFPLSALQIQRCHCGICTAIPFRLGDQ